MSIQILDQICRPKLNPQTKINMNLLNNNQRTTIILKNVTKGQFMYFGKQLKNWAWFYSKVPGSFGQVFELTLGDIFINMTKCKIEFL